MPEWWNGRHKGLKIPGTVMFVQVQFLSLVPIPLCLIH